MPIGTLEGVEARYGQPLDNAQETQVTVWLSDIERRLRRRIPDLDDRAALSADYAASVAEVEENAVVRILKNPDGFRAESEGSYSYSTDVRAASGFMMILDEEWALLGASSAFTIHPRIRRHRRTDEGNPDLQVSDWIWEGGAGCHY